MDEAADRDEAIVSVPEDRVVRGAYGHATRDLSTREKECASGLFPLNLIFESDLTGKWQRAYVSGGDDRWDLWSAFQARVIDTVKGFKVPLIRLPKETRKEAVCSVFERVNTGGVVLNVFELLTATYAGDTQYSAHHDGQDFSLIKDWQAIKGELCSDHQVFGTLDKDSGQETGLTSLDFLQAIALVRTYLRKQEFLAEHPGATNAPAVSCKRRDLLHLPLTDYIRIAPKTAEALSWVGRFLATQHVFRERDLPYGSQVVPWRPSPSCSARHCRNRTLRRNWPAGTGAVSSASSTEGHGHPVRAGRRASGRLDQGQRYRARHGHRSDVPGAASAPARLT